MKIDLQQFSTQVTDAIRSILQMLLWITILIAAGGAAYITIRSILLLIQLALKILGL